MFEANPDIPSTLDGFEHRGEGETERYEHRGYKGGRYVIDRTPVGGWQWSYDHESVTPVGEHGFLTAEEAFEDLSRGRGKWVANAVFDEDWWAGRPIPVDC